MASNKIKVLQVATTIAKTTETLIGELIDTGHYDFITLLVSYTKGDETGLNIYPYFIYVSGGLEYPLVEWTTAAGVFTAVAQKFQLTATAKRPITLDVRGVPFVKFYQGGSNNDGTPTGTLAAAYVLK
jgi:hypothetical protein